MKREVFIDGAPDPKEVADTRAYFGKDWSGEEVSRLTLYFHNPIDAMRFAQQILDAAIDRLKCGDVFEFVIDPCVSNVGEVSR